MDLNNAFVLFSAEVVKAEHVQEAEPEEEEEEEDDEDCDEEK